LCRHDVVSVERNRGARCADCWRPVRNPIDLPTRAGRLGVLRPGILNPASRRAAHTYLVQHWRALGRTPRARTAAYRRIMGTA
jgi:hypothetical protein